MIKSQRQFHRFVWLMLTPLLLLSIFYFSQPQRSGELIATNAHLRGAHSEVKNANTAEKGALP